MAAVLVFSVLIVTRAIAVRRHLVLAAQSLRAGQAVLSRATSGGEAFNVSSADLDGADADLRQAQSQLAAAQSDYRVLAPIVALASHLPSIGGTASALPSVIDFANYATLGARELVQGLQPLARARDDRTAGGSAAARFSDALFAGSPSLQAAQRDLTRAQQRRESIDEQAVLPVARGSLAPLHQWDSQWPVVKADLQLLVQLSPVLHAALGFNGSRTYAILGENSAELRPTGGFPSTIGIVQFANGEMTQQSYRSIYTYDPDGNGVSLPIPAAPDPIAQHLGITGWHIQDANWSPDFQTSASTLRAFLAYDGNVKVDGLIAFDSYAVKELLAALGPIDVDIDGETQRFTADNWLTLTTQLIFLDPEHPDTTAQKERVLGPLLQAVVGRVNSASGDQLNAVLQGFRTAIAERHVLFQFDDPTVQGLVYKYSADGTLRQTAGETTIYPVEANLSYTKIGPFVQQDGSLEVWCDEHNVCAQARLTLTWRNTVTAAQIADPLNRIGGDEWDAALGKLIKSTGVYGLYERIYAPQGAAVTNSTGLQQPIAETTDGNFAVFGTYLSVPAGETRSLSLDLTLPNREAEPGHLVLTIPKQPGTEDRGITVTVHTAGSAAPSSNLMLKPLGPQTYQYQGVFNRDLVLDLNLTQPVTGSHGGNN